MATHRPVDSSALPTRFGEKPTVRDPRLFRPPAGGVGAGGLTALLPPSQPQTAEQQKAHRQKLIRVDFERRFQEHRASLEDLFPFRIVCVWRITRYLVQRRGVAYKDQLLAEALAPADDNANPWYLPTPISRYRAGPGGSGLLRVVREAEKLPKDCAVAFAPPDGGGAQSARGLAFTPPPVPPRWRDPVKDTVPDEYDPERDPLLDCWIRAVATAVDDLALSDGAPDEPDMGRYGLWGLMDPWLARASWPNPHQVMGWEQLLVEEVLQNLVAPKEDDPNAGTIAGTQRMLRDRLGLSPGEVAGVLDMAKAVAEQSMSGDVEQAKAVMLMRLEDYVRRARESLNLREEMAALKQMSIIQGLAKAESEDINSEFVKLVDNVAQQRKHQKPQLLDHEGPPKEGGTGADPSPNAAEE